MWRRTGRCSRLRLATRASPAPQPNSTSLRPPSPTASACWNAGVRNHAWSMTSRLARAGVQPRRPATSPRVPRSRAGPYCGLGAILSAQTGGVRPSPAVGIVRARYDSRNNADANSIPPTTERAGAGYGSRPPCQRPCRSWNGWIAPTSAARRASVSTDISISPSLASLGKLSLQRRRQVDLRPAGLDGLFHAGQAKPGLTPRRLNSRTVRVHSEGNDEPVGSRT